MTLDRIKKTNKNSLDWIQYLKFCYVEFITESFVRKVKQLLVKLFFL